MTEICQYLKNWFDRDQKKWRGKINITGSAITCDNKPVALQSGQYYRIIGSLFNDGVHVLAETDQLTNEEFTGVIWSMAVPPDFASLVGEIEAWQAKYGNPDSYALSPYNSESFGGYSYTKSNGSSGSLNNGGAGTWQGTFAKRLSMWRKI